MRLNVSPQLVDGLAVVGRRFKPRGRNYTWTTWFTVPIEVRVA